MIRQLIILLFLLSKVNANWPFAYNEAYIHLHQVVCPNFFQLFVLAEKYGVQKVTHPPPNIFASLNYGFYELFICNSNGQHISSGCVQEILNDANYRYAHVPTLELTFLAENLLQNERYLVQSRQFDICIIDATYLMRLAWMQGQNYYLPSAYDRLQMPRKCWRISLEPMHINSHTRAKMDEAIQTKLARYRVRRNNHYAGQIIQLRKEVTAFSDRMIELDNEIKRLNAQVEQLKREGRPEIYTQITIDTLRMELQKEDEKREPLVKEEINLKVTYKKHVEDEVKNEEQNIKNNEANQMDSKYADIRYDNDTDEIVLQDENLDSKKRRKRDTGALIEKLKKMKSKKQHFLMNMAIHDLLPSGSMDVNGLVEDVLTIRKENTIPEEGKHLTYDSVLETSNADWQKLAENETIKGKINMIAVNKMKENIHKTLLVDLKDGIDLEKFALKRVSNLEKSIGEALEKEKIAKAEGPEKYNEYRKRLFHEVEKIVDATKVEEHAKEIKNIGESISGGKAGTSEIEEIIEEEKKGKKSEGGENPAESENDDHHNVKYGHQHGHGALKTGLQKSSQFLTKSAEYLADLAGNHLHKAATFSAEKLKKLGEIGGEAIEKYELKKRAKSVGESAVNKSKEILQRALTTGISTLNWAKDKTIEGAKHAAFAADLWKDPHYLHEDEDAHEHKHDDPSTRAEGQQHH